MLHPELQHQIAETIRFAAVKRTENRTTKYRIAGMEDAEILTLAPEPGILPALEHIELPKSRHAGSEDYWAQWEAADRAWNHALPPATVTKWAIAVIRHVDEGIRDEERRKKRPEAKRRAAD